MSPFTMVRACLKFFPSLRKKLEDIDVIEKRLQKGEAPLGDQNKLNKMAGRWFETRKTLACFDKKHVFEDIWLTLVNWLTVEFFWFHP